MRYIITLFFLVFFLAADAQTFLMSAGNDGATDNTCTGTFALDLGCAYMGSSIYCDDEDYTYTLCPDAPGQAIVIEFTMFDIIGTGTDVDDTGPIPPTNGDWLCIYDGPTTAATSLGCNSDLVTLEGGTIRASEDNPTGCLTFNFVADGIATIESVGGGWSGNISCATPCQTVIANFDGTTPADHIEGTGGYTDVCQGSTVTFFGSGSYPNNGTGYTQSDATSIFEWHFGDGTVVSGTNLTSVSHTFPDLGGYTTQLFITDINGCTSNNAISHKTRVSTTPIFDGTYVVNTPICIGECTDIIGQVTPVEGTFIPPNIVSDQLPLPDGAGLCYNTSIFVQEFNVGQTLGNADLIEISANLEHSYVGDLEITILCPNTSGTLTPLILHPYAGYAAVDNEDLGCGTTSLTDGGPDGNGANYIWSTAGTKTWGQAITDGDLIACADGLTNDLPGGVYASENDMTALESCLLNGNWTIKICDKLADDDGTLFAWGVTFDPSLYPAVETFTPTITATDWTGSDITATSGENITVCPATSGTKSYVYEVTDNFGCTYDTTVTLIVNPGITITQNTLVQPTCASPCSGSVSVTGSGGGGSPYSYSWSNGRTTTSATGLCTGVYTVTVSNASCSNTQSFTITAPTSVSVSVSATNATCNGASNGTGLVTPTGGTTPYTYLWSNGRTTAAVSGLLGGTPFASYVVSVTDGSGCVAIDSIKVAQPTAIVPVLTGVNITCNGLSNGTASSSVTGGTTPYSYLWSNGSAISTTSGLGVGTFTLTVTDASSCKGIGTVSITQPTAIVSSITTTNDPTFFGGSDGSINSSASGGTTAYTYAWSPAPAAGQTTANATNLSSGTYCVTVTDSKGCTSSSCATLFEPGALAPMVTPTPVSCFGGSDGTLSVTSSGGVTPHTYAWFNASNDAAVGSGNFLPNMVAGSYYVVVTDDVGITSVSNDFTITQPTALATSISSSSNVTCFGLCNGSVSTSIGGGTSPYTYFWNSGQTTANLSSVCASNYNIVTTDTEGCTSTASVTITQPALLSLAITATNPDCFGDTDGTAQVTATGGTTAYSYAWTSNASGQVTASITGLSAGAYRVTVTDNQSCTSTASVTLTTPAALSSSITNFNHVSCNGLCDGNAQVDGTGGTLPYIYNWSNGQANQTATGLCDGVITATITDDHLCKTVSSVTINEPSALNTSKSYTDVTCWGANNGTTTVTVGGGTPPYEYIWTPSLQTTATATGLSSGTHTVTVTDAGGCTTTTSLFVSKPQKIAASFNITDANCGQDNGAIVTSITGGTLPYTTIQWDDANSQTTASITDLVAGCYNLVVIDNKGCTMDTVACLNDIEGPTISLLSFTNATCDNECDGLVNFNVNGGTTPYSIFTWKDGSSTVLPAYNGSSSAWNLCGNQSYSLEVTDAAGCLATLTQFVSEPAPVISFAQVVKNVSCFAGNDGSALVLVGGGTSGYTYQWGAPANQNTSTATGMIAGVYGVTVTDANGCTTNTSTTITQPQQVLVSAVSTDALCYQASDGTATLTVSGGTLPYNYFWTPSQAQNPFVSGLPAGSYTVTVSDSRGCTSSTSTTVNEPTELTASITSDPATCSQANGVASIISVAGGTTDYTYLWTNSEESSSISGLYTGYYTGTVTDANGCRVALAVSVSDLISPSIDDIDIQRPQCYGDANGSATVVVSLGGGTTWDALWNDPQTQSVPTAVNLTVGNYCVTVTDNNGCTASQCEIVTQPQEVIPFPTGSTSLCYGECTVIWGALQGGTTPYPSPFITWDNGSLIGPGPHTVCPASTTDYTFTVSDANGCTAQDVVTVEVSEPLLISASGNATICIGEETTICAFGSGGSNVNAYTFEWTNSFTTNANSQSCQTVNPADTTEYRVVLSDGCSISDTANIVVSVNPLPPITFSNVVGEGCPGLEVPIAGSTSANFPNSTFVWDIGDTTITGTNVTSITHTYNTAGTYDIALTVTSQENCSNDTLISEAIVIHPAPVANFTYMPDSNSITIINSLVSFNASSSKGATMYSWKIIADTANGVRTQYQFNSLGTYPVELVVYNQYGCKDEMIREILIQEDFSIYVPNAFTPNDDAINDVFIPKAQGAQEDGYELYVFDRWGEIIFKTNNIKEGWNGIAREKKGKEIVQNDVYVWKMIVYDFKGEKHQLHGIVTVVR